MRIVFVSHEFPPQFGGGIGTYVAAMARILAARGHAVSVITISAHRYPQREYRDGLEIVRLPLAICGGPEPMTTLRSWQTRSDAVAELLGKMSRAGTVDVIEFGDYRGEAVSYLSSTKPGERPCCIVKLHTPLSVLNKYNASQPHYPVLESFEDQAILSADRLVSPSEALVREVRLHLPTLPHVDLLPYAADPAFLDVPRNPTAERETILYVGRLEERKGVETLIRAAPAVLEGCPGAVLHLIGGDTQVGSRSPSMKAILAEMLPANLRPRVVFHGALPRESLLRHYQQARVCVFPSLFENFPNTCLEAMALGRPVIGTDNSGMAEMIEDGISGRVVHAGDAEDLTAALIDLYNRSGEARRAMGGAAHERIRREYHPDRIAERMERLYGAYIGDEHRVVSDSPAAHRDRVAAIIPCFNHGRFIREAIDSVQAQQHPVSELVVVDDGSTEADTIDTLARLEGEGIRVIRQPNQGLATARNTGVRATQAEFYFALDSDDRIAPDFIAKLLPALKDQRALGYSYSHAKFFGAADGVWECPTYKPRRLLVENLSVATALVRREAFDLVGGYNADMVYGFEDWDFWLALLAVGYHGQCTPEPLFFYRKHPRGQSMLDRTQQHRAAMVQKMVEHHRTLFAAMLEVSLTDKDSLFFQAHMQAAHLREALGRSGAGAASPADSDLFQSLAAQAELDYIENSGTWRMVQRIRRSAAYRWLAEARFGSDWDRQDPDEGPCQRLARIKASRFYRTIAAAKATGVYQWYARRKYGPDFSGFKPPLP